jgi:hypothetical protein
MTARNDLEGVHMVTSKPGGRGLAYEMPWAHERTEVTVNADVGLGVKKLLHFVLLGSLVATPIMAADRLTDRDVKALVAHIEDGRDRFDNALDDRLKRAIVREPAGEVNVSRFLDDFQENIDRLEERLKPEYAASTEVATLLWQASAIDGFFRRQPAGTKGVSEWNRLATDLKALGLAYGADFPLKEGTAVRRIGDRELFAAVEDIARSSERLQKALENDLKKDTDVAKSEREAIVGEADLLEKYAKALRSRVKDGKPSSAEAEAVMERAAKLRPFIQTHNVPTSSAAWAAITFGMRTLTDAYRSSAFTAVSESQTGSVWTV